MIYPKKPPKQTKEADYSGKLPLLKQKEKLKELISQNLKTRYDNKFAYDFPSKVNESLSKNPGYFQSNPIKLEVETPLKVIDMDQHSIRSNKSVMSGASDFHLLELDNKLKSKRKQEIINLLPQSAKINSSRLPRNDEQNLFNKVQITKQENEGNRSQSVQKKQLDNEQEKELEVGLNKINHWFLAKRRVQKKRENGKINQSMMDAKIEIEQEIAKEQIDKLRSKRIKERKDKQLANSVILENVVLKERRDLSLPKPRREENVEKEKGNEVLPKIEIKKSKAQKDLNTKIGDEKELAATKEKEEKERLDRIVTLAEKFMMEMIAEKEKNKGLVKVNKWGRRNVLDEQELERKDKKEAEKKRMLEIRAFHEQQIAEKIQKRKQEKMENVQHLQELMDRSIKVGEWEKEKEIERKEQMKSYLEDLRKQIQDKFEKRKNNDSFFNLLATHNKRKYF